MTQYRHCITHTNLDSWLSTLLSNFIPPGCRPFCTAAISNATTLSEIANFWLSPVLFSAAERDNFSKWNDGCCCECVVPRRAKYGAAAFLCPCANMHIF